LNTVLDLALVMATLELREGDKVPSAATVKKLVCEAVALNEK